MTGDTTLAAGTLGYEFDWEQAAYASRYPLSRITLSDTNSWGQESQDEPVPRHQRRIGLWRGNGAMVMGARWQP